MENFQDYAYYYNAFYREKEYHSEAEKVHVLMNKYGNHISDIIEFGCGTGRYGLELMNMGYQYTGIDISNTMIEIAEKGLSCSNQKARFEVADIRAYKTEKKYDAVVSLFHVVSYQNENNDVCKVFKTARSCLKLNGIFLFDVWYGPGVLSDKPSIRVKKVTTEENHLIRIATPVMHEERNIVDVNYDIYIIDRVKSATRTIKEIHSMRYFFRPELEMFLEQAGFKLMCNVDCITLDKTNFDSWTSYFVAKAV